MAEVEIVEKKSYYQAIVALVVLGLCVLPFLASMLGFAVRLFLWTAGFSPLIGE